jgi:hypothetical protein
MKKIHSSNRLAGGSTTVNKAAVPAQQPLTKNHTSGIVPPDEATVLRLNAIAREYPFCAWMKFAGNRGLL